MAFGGRANEIEKLKQDLSTTQTELKRREKQLRREADDKLAFQAQLIEKLAKSRFSLKVKETRIVWEIMNWDGDIKVARTYLGVHTGEGIQVRFLKHKAYTSTPGNQFYEAKLLEEISSPGVSMEFKEEAENTWSFQINFPEGLTNTKAGADYAFEYASKRGVLMTKEAAEVAYRNDPRRREAVYHINEVFNERLQLEIKFPPGYPAKTNCLALINDVVHEEATKALNTQQTEHGVFMKVNNPLPGFSYLIEWEAPSDDEYRRLKESYGNKLAE